jgi:hypothetical protein
MRVLDPDGARFGRGRDALSLTPGKHPVAVEIGERKGNKSVPAVFPQPPRALAGPSRE